MSDTTDQAVSSDSISASSHNMTPLISNFVDNSLAGSNPNSNGDFVNQLSFNHDFLSSTPAGSSSDPNLPSDSNRSGSASSKLAGRFYLRLALSPNLHRHKVVVYRDEKRLLKQAESIMTEMGSSNAILEIAFNGEVGFGLGPTLEFYTLISRQLMKSTLGMWHGSDLTSEGYIIPPTPGLYPRPIGKQTKSSVVREVN